MKISAEKKADILILDRINIWEKLKKEMF